MCDDHILVWNNHVVDDPEIRFIIYNDLNV